MCRTYTIWGLMAGLFIAGSLFPAFAQAPLSWKNLGGTSINADLAGPATGDVTRAWYSPANDRLSVETASGRIFETQDFEHWRLNAFSDAPSTVGLNPLIPQGNLRMVAAGSRLYAAGVDNVFASDDAGRNWLNLTGFNNRSIIGGGFNGLAVSPANPHEIVVVNKSGAWRSMDGGLSWTSLNKELPNLAVRRFAGSRNKVVLEDGSVAELHAGEWTPSSNPLTEDTLRKTLADSTGRNISAALVSGSFTYAGTADGRLLVSRSGTSGWNESPSAAASAITRIWADSGRPEVALAAAGEQLWRTVNGGLFWDNVTGNLPSGAIHGIAADRSAGVVYVASDRGLWAGKVSLNAAGAEATQWTTVSRDLPAAQAWDVLLNTDNTLTVALDGYGVFETTAPHKAAGVRVVNSADLSPRPAAPGSLISVMGAQVREARGVGPLFPVIAASSTGSQLQVPFEAAVGDITLALEGTNERWTVPLSIRDTSPAIFVDSEGYPLLLDAESGLVLDAGVTVHAGSSVALLATGLGRVTPDWPSGTPAPLDSPPKVRGAVTAFLDGAPLQVVRATLAPGYVGYYVIELRIPPIVNRGTAELRIVTDRVESNRVRLYLESTPARQ